MDAARATRRAKLAEADALLAGLDGHVLETLGLPAYPPQRAVFAVRSFEVKYSRVDPDFHSLRSRTIRDVIDCGHFPAYPVSQLCASIVAGFAAGRQDQAFDFEAGVPHPRPLNLMNFPLLQPSLCRKKRLEKAIGASGVMYCSTILIRPR